MPVHHRSTTVEAPPVRPLPTGALAVVPGAIAALRGRSHLPEVSADLAARHLLCCELAHAATFQLDVAGGSLSSSTNLAAVIGGSPSEAEGVLRRLLTPVTVCPGPWDEYQMEHRVRHDDGSERYLTIRAEPLDAGFDGEGRDLIIGAVVDVSENRQAQANLTELVERYRALLDVSPDLVVVHQDGFVRYANPACAANAGIPLEEIIGRSIAEFVHPDDLASVYERMAMLRTPGDATEPVVARLLPAGGEPVRMEAVSVLATWDGRPAYQVLMRNLAERDRAEQVMEMQTSILAEVGDAVIFGDHERRIITWNAGAERLYGWTAAEAIGRRIDELLDVPGERIQALGAALRDQGRYTAESAHRRRDGTMVDVYVVAWGLADDHGAVQSVLAVMTDLRERRAAEAAKAAEARFSTVAASLREGVLIIGPDTVIQSANPAAAEILGVEIDDLVGIVLGETDASVIDEAGNTVTIPDQIEAIQRGGAGTLTHLLPGTDGSPRWLSATWSLLPAAEGEERGTIVTTFSDVTGERNRAREAQWAASHDELTGLSNRAAVRARLDEVLDGQAPVAVIHLGLDRFKEVNSLLNHDAGDQVLVAQAERLRGAVAPGDELGRLLGDEFVVIHRPAGELTGHGQAGVARAASAEAARLVEILGGPMSVDVEGMPVAVTVTAGAGVVATGDDAVPLTAARVLQRAGLALERAKEQGRGRVQIFDAAIGDRVHQRFRLREELRQALDSGEVEVHYQPIWRAAPAARDCVLDGFEALVRWQHPVHGWMNPTEFVALAEETGLIGQLGRYVLSRACTQAAAWRQLGRDVYVAVNLTAREARDIDIVHTVSEALYRSGLDGRALWLDLPQAAIADDELPPARLNELRELGVQVAIDDFGVGASSLTRLRDYAIDALKLDRRVVADMTSSSAPDGTGDGGAVVESVLALAHKLGLSVVAEGVETDEQLARLAELEVDRVQGFLLGRAVTADRTHLDGTDAARPTHTL